MAPLAQGLGPRCHFFSTFFANKLYKDAGYNYDQVGYARVGGTAARSHVTVPIGAQVRRWTLPNRLASSGQASECILDCDRIVVPVHQGMHWVCAVVDLQHKKLVYYDSLRVGCTRTCLHSCRSAYVGLSHPHPIPAAARSSGTGRGPRMFGAPGSLRA